MFTQVQMLAKIALNDGEPAASPQSKQIFAAKRAGKDCQTPIYKNQAIALIKKPAIEQIFLFRATYHPFWIPRR